MTVSRLLVCQYGNNYEEKNLRRIMQFATLFEDERIVVPLARQLSKIENDWKNEIYTEGTRITP